MRFLPLIWSGQWRKPGRTVLIFFQVTVVFALFGVLQGLKTAVAHAVSMIDSRRRELATLRAIGFGSAAIGAAMLVESILLALPGALLGGALAWVLFHDMSVSPFGFSFQLDVTPSLVLIGIAWALGMGFVGGVLPAIRAGRVPVTTALQAA
jgi:putative ABC transport system permease protein